MTKLRKILTVFALAFSLFSMPAWAISMDEAKAKGLIGEQINGYLGYVKNPNGSLRALVEGINKKRRAAYNKGAKNAGVERKVFEIRMGQRLQDRVPPGQYIQLQNGNWRRK